MNSENSDPKDAIDKPGSNIQVIDNENVIEMNYPDSPTQPTDKITLTSRRGKKHVSIHDDTSSPPKEISVVEDALDHLENNFTIGIEEIRKSLKLLRCEKKSYELHVKSLEESLRKSNGEKEKYLSLIDQLKSDIEFVAAKLEATRKENEALHGENRNLQSDHEGHLHSIANQHRRKFLAKKTVKRWKEKLRKDHVQTSRVAELLEENQKLKSELLLYHESAKHAFLRSANALNSEALSLFQDTTARYLNAQQSNSARQDSSRSFKSDVSYHSSSSSANESDVSREKENEKHIRHRKNSLKFYSDDSEKRERKRDQSAQSRPHSDNELEAVYKSVPKPKPRIKDFLPHPLRHETKQIMKQLDTNRRPNLNLLSDALPKNQNESCQSKSHLHICHCTPLPGRPGNCPFCFAGQNYNFANMPTSAKAKPELGATLNSNKIRSNSFHCVSGQKPKVIYKSSGSTVVVEKHLGN